MIQRWKVSHIGKGMLTYVPVLNTYRQRRDATGGSGSSRYCYAVWLRHLVVLHRYGFDVKNAIVGELGPGDSIGTGLAALLSGARRYVGLDIVPYSATADLPRLVRELGILYEARTPIPNQHEFPRVRPRLNNYEFPRELVDLGGLAGRVARLTDLLASGPSDDGDVAYHAPWTSTRHMASASLDLIFSQAVLQYVDDLEETYRTMFTWLKPGGYCSHSVGFGATHLSPFWNGHWAYTPLQWRLVRGRREYVLNRQPFSSHMRFARAAGFELLHADIQRDANGLPVEQLAEPFRHLSGDDSVTCGAMLILRKPDTTTQ